MSGFQDLASAVMRQTRLNVNFFAQTVTYKTAGGDSSSIAAHVRHDVRLWAPPDSNDQEIVDQIHVEIDREDLDAEPAIGDRITLSGESDAYLYACKGSHTFASWKAVFERRRMITQGVPKGLDKRKLSPRK